MDKDLRQEKTPFFSALTEYEKTEVVSFDVPGHKMGKVDNDFTKVYGNTIYRLDVNAPIGLDNLNHPTSVIKESEELLALAFSAEEAYILVNGCSEAIQVMMMSVLDENDYIIMPRNVHKSVINSLILSGATPIFMDVKVDEDYHFAKNVDFDTVKEAIDLHPFAKAILIIHPTYFGEVSDLKKIVDYAHEKKMIVLVDEAHGTQYAFSNELPTSASSCKADLIASSMHKTGLSLTQSSILLKNGNLVDSSEIRTAINVLQSTSPSNLLIASVDVARKDLYFNGETKIHNTLKLVREFYQKCANFKYVEVLTEDYFKNKCFKYDPTKLIVSFRKLGLSGYKAYKRLRERFGIQAELGEAMVVLFILTPSTTAEELNKLYEALLAIETEAHIRNHVAYDLKKMPSEFPKSYLKPREAFNSDKIDILTNDSIGYVSAEQIMIYPPGIPLIIPGEQIDANVVETINYYLDNNFVLIKDSPDNYIRVVKMKE